MYQEVYLVLRLLANPGSQQADIGLSPGDRRQLLAPEAIKENQNGVAHVTVTVVSLRANAMNHHAAVARSIVEEENAPAVGGRTVLLRLHLAVAGPRQHHLAIAGHQARVVETAANDFRYRRQFVRYT